MRTRTIPRAGLTLSEIGFGCGGNAGLMVGSHEQAQNAIVAAALAAGISYFDNAPDYGNGAAERHLGRALDHLGADPIITTKIEIRTGDLADIAGHVERSVAESLERLGRDSIDIVQIHNGPVAGPTALPGRSYRTLGIADYLRPGGAVEGIERVLSQGLARHAGFVSRGNDADIIAALLERDAFSLINLPYSLLDPTPGTTEFSGALTPDYGGLIVRAAEQGIGIAAFSPLAGGLLTDALLDGAGTHPLARTKDARALEQAGRLRLARRFQALARDLAMPLTRLAYRFALSHPGVTTVLGGFSDPAHVTDMAAASADGPLPRDVLAAIEAEWRAHIEDQ